MLPIDMLQILNSLLSSKDFTYKNFKIIEEPLVKVTLQEGAETNTLFGSAEMIQNKIDFLDFIISTKLKPVFFKNIILKFYSTVLNFYFSKKNSMMKKK